MAVARRLDAGFSLKVIRAYDALVSGQPEKAAAIAKTTVDERTPLRDAVNLLVSKRALPYEKACSIYPSEFRRSVYRVAGAGDPAGSHRIRSPPGAGRRAGAERTTTGSPGTSHLPNRHKFSVCRHRGVGLRDRNVAAAPEGDSGLSEDVIWMLRKTGWVVELAEDMADMNSMALAQLIQRSAAQKIQAFKFIVKKKPAWGRAKKTTIPTTRGFIVPVLLFFINHCCMCFCLLLSPVSVKKAHTGGPMSDTTLL